MAQYDLMTGVVADTEMADGWVLVDDEDDWYMTEDQWLYIQELEVPDELGLFLDLFGPGMYRLPAEWIPA